MSDIDRKITQVGEVWATAMIRGNRWASNYWLCTLRTLVRQRKALVSNGFLA
jgi:hypothetical protein